TLFTACELGVFDLLLGSERPLSAEEISQAIGANLDGTQRLLDACTGLELLTAQQQEHGRVYSNKPDASLYLTQSSPVSLYHSIQYSSRTIYLCWYHLTDAVREGRNQYQKAFGVSSEDLFEALYRSDEEMVKFMHLMNSIWNICGRDVVTAFDLSPFRSVYDLGGCSGGFAKHFTTAYPECTVTIYDLPKVVQVSRQHFVTDGNQRIEFHEGGGVLLVEALLLEDGSGPLSAQLYSLNMLVQTEGRERTADQYRALLSAAGFGRVQVRYTGKIYDAVLGYRQG
ncbi:hypothetical protein NHX12_006972, partial [Muraenolepis orangiensis]